MLDELGYPKTGILRRESQGKASFPEQGRGDGLPDAGLAENRVVAQVDQHRLRLVPIEHHDGLLARRAQCRRGIVLQFPNAYGFHFG